MGTISGCRYLKENLKAKNFINVKSTIQRCPNKIIKIFLIEYFFHLPPVSATPVVNLKGIVQPFELGGVTRLIRTAVKFCMAGN